MVATPHTLRQFLNFQGVLIDVVENEAYTVNTPDGSFSVPEMLQGALRYARDETLDPKTLGWALYIDRLPVFNEAYRKTITGHILDRFADRRPSWDTPEQFALAFRRWGNLHMPFFNQRYLSASVTMPLDTVDARTEFNSDGSHNENATESRDETETGNLTQTNRSRDVASDFPQEILSGNEDYASNATDSNGSSDQTTGGSRDVDVESEKTGSDSREDITVETGRRATVASLLEEQRAAFLNVDLEVLERMEELFLGVFDQGEAENTSLLWWA